VQPRDAVTHVGELERQHRHAERLLLVARLLPPEARQRAAINAHLLHVVAEILFDHPHREGVVARGHRRVRREARAGLHCLSSRREIEPVLLHQHPDALQHRERRVPLIHVAHRGDLPEQLERANAADAQNDLLLDPRVLIAAIQLGGDGPVLLPVLWDVRVEQIQRDPPDLDAPDAQEHVAAGQGRGGDERLARGVELGDEGEGEEVVLGIALLLPPLGVQVLPKIPLAVHE
jgi:hypothetical protein